MPKSKNRKSKKEHKKKVDSYRNKVKSKQKAIKKSYIEMLKAKQQQEMNSKLENEKDSKDVVENVDMGITDLNDDFNIDDNEDKKE